MTRGPSFLCQCRRVITNKTSHHQQDEPSPTRRVIANKTSHHQQDESSPTRRVIIETSHLQRDESSPARRRTCRTAPRGAAPPSFSGPYTNSCGASKREGVMEIRNSISSRRGVTNKTSHHQQVFESSPTRRVITNKFSSRHQQDESSPTKTSHHQQDESSPTRRRSARKGGLPAAGSCTLRRSLWPPR